MGRRRLGVALTRQRAAHIKHLLETTNLNHAQIAAEVGSINQGRVSEVKNGKRFPDVSASEYGGGS
jgi:predicted XRE-type DNA-binding protein